MYVAYNAPLVAFINSTLADNAATGTNADDSVGGGGGAVYFSSPRGVLQLSDGTTLRNNTALAASGGAILLDEAHRVHLSGATLSGNSALSGGAVAVARRSASRDLATCISGEDRTLASFSGDFALVPPGQLVPATDMRCEWVVVPPDPACVVELTVSSLSATFGRNSLLSITDTESGETLFYTEAPDGSTPPPFRSTSGKGLRVRYTLVNAAAAQIFFGGILASFRAVCPELPEDAAVLSALYGQGSADAQALLHLSALGGFAMLIMDRVHAEGNTATAGNGGAVEFVVGAPQQQMQLQGAAAASGGAGALGRVRGGLVVVSASNLVRPRLCRHHSH